MSMRHAANVIGNSMRFHQGMGRLGRLGYLGDSVQADPGMSFGPVGYDPSQLPYIPSPTLSPVGTPVPVPVSPGVTTAVVQSSTWPSWGTYAAIGAGVLALIWLSRRKG